uniref:C-X-C motif chemokine n=1 Tax=Oryzias melastigma TaxID=30732 RepID=A0A3B3C3Y0_ORYME
LKLNTFLVSKIEFLTLKIHITNLTVQGMNLRCLCITKERALIGRLIGAVEVNLASSYCTEVEIIATLVKSEKKICLDPEASWVKKVLNAMKKRPG